MKRTVTRATGCGDAPSPAERRAARWTSCSGTPPARARRWREPAGGTGGTGGRGGAGGARGTGGAGGARVAQNACNPRHHPGFGESSMVRDRSGWYARENDGSELAGRRMVREKNDAGWCAMVRDGAEGAEGARRLEAAALHALLRVSQPGALPVLVLNAHPDGGPDDSCARRLGRGLALLRGLGVLAGRRVRGGSERFGMVRDGSGGFWAVRDGSGGFGMVLLVLLALLRGLRVRAGRRVRGGSGWFGVTRGGSGGFGRVLCAP